MKRTSLRRKTRIAPVNPERRKRTFERNYGERGDPVRAMPCLVMARDYRTFTCSGNMAAAHAIARGMGGAKGDRRDLVPLCYFHHVAAGERGTGQRAAFEKRHGVDLQVEAARIAAELDARGIP